MTSEIQKAIAKMQVLRYHNPVCENINVLWGYEYDVVSVSKSGMICEFEVKISRSDFLTQKEKDKAKYYSQPTSNGIAWSDKKRNIHQPNYFSYCCPANLIKPHEVPKYAGLYYYANGEIIEVKKPMQIHKNVFNIDKLIMKILRYNAERQYLGVCRMTYENREKKKRREAHKALDILSQQNKNNGNND